MDQSSKKINLTWLTIAAIITVGLVAWYPVLNFWFLKAFEASWLHDALPYTLDRLIRTHAFIYWIDLQLFGWDPRGWYATAILLQLIASVTLYFFAYTLTARRSIATIAALIFVANTAYNDVLTWGSFNSYYPLLLTFMLLSLTQFLKYRQTNKLIYWYGSMVTVVLGFLVRETGIIIVPMLGVLDLVTVGNLLKINTWWAVIKRQWPYYVLLFGFLFIRSHYGGTIGDTVDSNVKMQMRLVHDKLWAEYARVTLLTFGKLIPPMVIPYTILNDWREAAMKTGDGGWLEIHYFPNLGYWLYGLLGLVTLATVRIKKLFPVLLFSFIWIGGLCLFLSLAVPNVHEVQVRPYEIITLRYRYHAFAGAALLYACLIVTVAKGLGRLISRLLKQPKFEAKVILGLLGITTAAIVFYNVTALHGIEKSFYESTYKAEREFHLNFQRLFPTLPDKVGFYIYPHAPNINDNLFEWYLIKDLKYPNLKGQPYRIESQVEAVVDKVSKGKGLLTDYIFLDYNPTAGLIDRTKELSQLIAEQKVYTPTLNHDGPTNFLTPNFVGPPVELPYDVKLQLSASYGPAVVGKSADSKKFRALVDYSVDRQQYLKTIKLTTCRTLSQRDEEPFYFYAPGHLVDGNVGRRSAWIADGTNAWAAAELPSVQSIKAVAWGSIVGSTRVPATYSYFSSTDGTNWQSIKTVTNNTRQSAIDMFDEPVKTKYLKMAITTTNSGDFAELDEFELITTAGQAALPLFTDRDELLTASRQPFNYVASADDFAYAQEHGLNFGWGRFVWGADQGGPFEDSQYAFFSYPITGSSQTVTIVPPEAEIYAAVAQLLTKHYTSLAFDFLGAPITTSANSVQLVPRYKLVNQ